LAGKYTVERELGRGGMATVYLAEDLRHERRVAIKLLDPELARSVGGERFLREIQLAAKLQHPHILPLYESGEANGLLYYVMPFVEGENLRSKMDREKQLALDEALKISGEVASALAFAHSRGIVHRDIKPENIMLSAGTAVVADFGIARAVDPGSSHSLTQTGTVIGTPQYMSPEQVAGSTDIDGRSDQYSLACVVYEMMVGQPPFTGPTPLAVMARHSMDVVSPPSIVRPSIPDATEDAILRALAKVPADRFPTMAQFAEGLLAPSAVTSGRHSAMARVSAPRRPSVVVGDRAVTVTLQRRSLLWVGLAVATILLIGVGGWFLVGRRGAAAHASAASASAPTPGLDPRTIGVLYFGDLSSDRRLSYVADGFTESLIDELSRVPGLNVISRGGVAAWRESTASPDSLGRALQAGTLVQGRVEPIGSDRIRVQVWLVDGNSGADLGKRASFERPASDLIGARDSLVSQAAELMRRQLGQEVQLRRQQEGTRSSAAWSLLQQAEVLSKAGEAAANGGDTLRFQRFFHSADSLLGQAEAGAL